MSMRWMAWSLGGMLALAGIGCGEGGDGPDYQGGPGSAVNGNTGGTTGNTTSTGGTAGAGTTGTTGVGGTTGLGTTGTTGLSTTGTTGLGTTGTTGLGTTGTTGLDTTGTTGLGTTGTTGSTTGGTGTLGADCTSLPPVTDYAAKGPFADAKMFPMVGPNGNYFMFRPDASLGKDGFTHPIGVWGNGIATTPDQYQQLLTHLASHGFVIIACPDVQSEEPCLTAGIDWLVQQNTAPGPLQGKLDTSREVTIGYSWGGGAAIDTSDRPNVKATVSLHGMPPRRQPWDRMHAPLLLFTSTGDGFVTKRDYVAPNFGASKVQTFMATLDDETAGHLYPVDEDAISCVASFLLGTCKSAIAEQAPTAAWMRFWACEDEGARSYFYGDDCKLCSGQWTDPQRKNWQ